MNKNHKRISAAVLSLALGFTIAGAPILAPVAGAQAASQLFNVDSAQINDIDSNENVSLTINKYEGLPVADLETPNGVTPLEATFDIQRLDLDLTEIADWQTLAGLQGQDLKTAPLPIDNSFTAAPLVTTGGTATLSKEPTIGAVNETVNAGFTMGAYLITEQAKDGFRVAEPFLVVLPFLDATENWTYSQTVNPKNQAISLEKSVTDSGLTLGDEITYTISAAVPGGDLTSIQIVDNLPDELAPATAVTVYTMEDINSARVELPLTDTTTDFTAIDGNGLEVTFGNNDLAALQTLRNAHPELQIIVEFNSRIVVLPTNGVIQNDAAIHFPGGISFSTEDPDVPDEGAETRLGSLTINKTDADGNTLNDPDAGTNDANDAIFELYRCNLVGTDWTIENAPIPAIAGATGAAVATEAELATYLTDNNIAALPTQFTTVNGQVELYGVQALDFVNGDSTTSSLCALEVQAPTGYLLNDTPQPVVFSNSAEFEMVVDVINLQDADININLPATGGNGTMAMIAAGVVVAAAGGAAAVRGNRARK